MPERVRDEDEIIPLVEERLSVEKQSVARTRNPREFTVGPVAV